MILATLDVKSLYTNIPHNEGIEACRIALETEEVQQPPTEDLIHLIKVILTRNHFVFNEEHHDIVQLNGTAMGSKMVPSYAKIQILESATNKPTVWWIYNY